MDSLLLHGSCIRWFVFSCQRKLCMRKFLFFFRRSILIHQKHPCFINGKCLFCCCCRWKCLTVKNNKKREKTRSEQKSGNIIIWNLCIVDNFPFSKAYTTPLHYHIFSNRKSKQVTKTFHFFIYHLSKELMFLTGFSLCFSFI